jgi:YbgC/YbaW family acyl-CoA thioester hydrolase
MPYEHKVTRMVEFSETDMAGIMHFANFFRFMETAEHGFLRSLGFSVALPRNGLELCLPRVHAECDYLAPLRFEDEVLIHLLVEKKGPRSLAFQFRFYKMNGPGTPEVAHGRLTVVCAAREEDGALKTAMLPRAISDLIEEAPRAMLADGRPRSKRPAETDGSKTAVPLSGAAESLL